MGREVHCAAEFDGFRGEGKLLLETDELIFRGPRRLVVARSAIQAAIAREDWLEITHGRTKARFHVGAGAERWAHDILHPKSLIDKLDVKATARVAVLGVGDADFVAQVRAHGARVNTRLGQGPYDLIFCGIDEASGLARLADLAGRLEQTGAVWIITPKGTPALGHEPIVEAARAAGLVDIKTARFSATHTALKLVIPRARRTA